MPECAEIVDGPLFATNRRITDIQPVLADAAENDHGVSQARRPAPLLFVTGIDLVARVESHQKNGGPTVGLQKLVDGCVECLRAVRCAAGFENQPAIEAELRRAILPGQTEPHHLALTGFDAVNPQ